MREDVENRVGEILAGKYRLDEELGRGGMGAVYRAFHLGVHRAFAVKALHAEIAERKQHAKRFLLEAQAAGRIGHPGILEVYDVGDDADGRPFMVMELLDGAPLSRLVASGPLDLATACWVASEVLAILEAAHAADVVHRDVKPQNVFLVDGGGGKTSVKLLDFGIAKFRDGDGPSITGSGEIIGSPLYMAPEQARGDADVDARADVWSVGAMLYEMLTGRAAHVASTAIAVLAKVLTEVVPPPSAARPEVPAALDAVVTTALSLDRGARFASAKAMREALAPIASVLGAPPSLALPRGAVPPAGDSNTVLAATTPASAAASIPGASTPPPFDAAISNVATSRDVAPGKRRLWVGGGAAAVGAAAFVALWAVRDRASTTATSSVASASAGERMASAPPPVEAAPAPAPTPTPEPAPAPAPAESRVKLVVAPAPPTARAAPRPSASAPRVSSPECAAGEVPSAGHCCPRGMVWLSGAGRCERPLATSF